MIAVPKSFTPEQAQFLQELVIKMSKNSLDVTPTYIVPAKPQVGMVRYFGGAIDATITSEGLWQYTSTGWERL